MSSYVFISYSNKDRHLASVIAKTLEYEDFRVWWDRPEIEPGENFINEIEKGLDSSFAVVVVWTEDAKNSPWVGKEIGYAADIDIPVVPLRFEDVRSPLVGATHYIDCMEGFHHGIGKLIRYLNTLIKDKSVREAMAAKAWHKPSPSISNQFLADNAYIETGDPNFRFARNDFTSKLHGSGRFVSFVAIPISSISPEGRIEVVPLCEELNINKEGTEVILGIKEDETTPPDKYLDLSFLVERRASRHDFLRFRPVPRSNKSFHPLTYIRFHDSGAIEFIPRKHHVIQEDTVAKFRFIVIIGYFWKFLNSLKSIYKVMQYRQNIQILLNMSATRNSLLGHFAGKGEWTPDPIVLGTEYYSQFQAEFNHHLCQSKYLQFVYEINLEKVSDTDAEDIVDDFRKQLQQSFNFDLFEPRHFPKGENAFDWELFHSILDM